MNLEVSVVDVFFLGLKDSKRFGERKGRMERCLEVRLEFLIDFLASCELRVLFKKNLN